MAPQLQAAAAPAEVPLTKSEYKTLDKNISKIRRECLNVEGLLESSHDVLIGVEERGGTWATPTREEMYGMRENASVIEEAARLRWKPTIDAHKPKTSRAEARRLRLAEKRSHRR